jgi:hypothetical protein
MGKWWWLGWFFKVRKKVGEKLEALGLDGWKIQTMAYVKWKRRDGGKRQIIKKTVHLR